jgi:hypothetical protein
MSEDEAYIGILLNHFLEVMQFNSHEVAQVRINNGARLRVECRCCPNWTKVDTFVQFAALTLLSATVDQTREKGAGTDLS